MCEMQLAFLLLLFQRLGSLHSIQKGISATYILLCLQPLLCWRQLAMRHMMGLNRVGYRMDFWRTLTLLRF